MLKVALFEEDTARYEGWFEEYKDPYQSDLNALRRLLPEPGYGIEIGVGSARFATPLGMQVGIKSAGNMLDYARS